MLNARGKNTKMKRTYSSMHRNKQRKDSRVIMLVNFSSNIMNSEQVDNGWKASSKSFHVIQDGISTNDIFSDGNREREHSLRADRKIGIIF